VLWMVGGVEVEEWGSSVASAGKVVTSSKVDKFLVEEGWWEEAAHLEVGRSSPGVCGLAGWLYVVGGLTGTAPSDGNRRRQVLGSVCRYREGEEDWEELPPLPSPCVYPALVALGEELWVMGGLDSLSQATADVWVLDTTSLAWRAGPPLSQPRRGAMAFLHGNRIFVCGGTDGGLKQVDSCEVLEQGSRRWEVGRLPSKSWRCPVVGVTVRTPVRLLHTK